MSSITDIAMDFFKACETGAGWAGCRAYCTDDASFSSQAGPIAEITAIEAYADWMKGLLTIIPDGRYEIRAFATDDERRSVSAYAVFSGTHTGDGGPVPPTGKTVESDYVYVMTFEGDKIRHVTKIWNADWALKQLGWA